MREGLTIKQRQARIKNFTKGRIKAALSAIQYAIESEDVDIVGECKYCLKEADVFISNALNSWDKKI